MKNLLTRDHANSLNYVVNLSKKNIKIIDRSLLSDNQIKNV